MSFPAGSILMLHRVAPYNNKNIIYNENMKISPEELDEIIISFKNQKWAFVCLDEVAEILHSRNKPKHKFVAITLDDGYKDNLTMGIPVFQSHNIPVCIYITNSFPNKTTNLWWYALENLIMNNDTITSMEGKTIDNLSLGQKKKNFLLLRQNVLNDYFRDPLSYLKNSGNLTFNLSDEIQNMCLTWPELIRLSENPLVTIGCHTINHLPLARLNEEEVKDEIADSKTEIERRINKKVSHFAFPFGSKNEANQREYEIARTIGFDTIVTTIHGHVHINDNVNKLDRIFLYPIKNNNITLKRLLFYNVKTAISLVKKLL